MSVRNVIENWVVYYSIDKGHLSFMVGFKY